MPLLRAFIDALPGLKAEEVYELSHGVALGSGQLSREGHRRITGYLDRAIRHSAGPSNPDTMPTRDEWEAQMIALGFMTGGEDDDPE